MNDETGLGQLLSTPRDLLQRWIRVWCDGKDGSYITQHPRRARFQQERPKTNNSTLLCRCINILTEHFPTTRETLTVQYNTKYHYLYREVYTIQVYRFDSVTHQAKQYMVTRVKLVYTHCINPDCGHWLLIPDLFHTILRQLQLFYVTSRNYSLKVYKNHLGNCSCTRCRNHRQIFKLTLSGVTYGLVYCPEKYSKHCSPLIKRCSRTSCPCRKVDFRKVRRYAHKLRSAKGILQEIYDGISVGGFGEAEVVPLR